MADRCRQFSIRFQCLLSNRWMRQGGGGGIRHGGGTECWPSTPSTYLLLQVSGSVGERNATGGFSNCFTLSNNRHWISSFVVWDPFFVWRCKRGSKPLQFDSSQLGSIPLCSINQYACVVLPKLCSVVTEYGSAKTWQQCCRQPAMSCRVYDELRHAD